jgi:hypothetical protein
MRDLMGELNLTGNELYNPEMQDRMAEQLVRRRQGQGTTGMRNEWQGLNGVRPELIDTALGAQSIERVDPTVAAERTRAATEAKREATKAAKDEARAVEGSQEAYDRLIGSLDPAIAATQRFDQAQEEVNEALARGQITTEQAARAIQLAREEMTQTFIDIAEAADTDQFDRFKEGFADINEELLQAALNGENVLQVLLKIIAQRFLMQGMDNIAGGLAGQATSNPGGWLAKAGRLLSFDGGGSTGSGPRSGGMDGKGGFMAMLHPDETVTDHTKGQSIGGAKITQNFNINGATGNSEVVGLVKSAVGQSSKQLRSEMPGIMDSYRKRLG